MTATEQTEIAGRTIVLYDGVCGLCNRIVRLLLRVDRAGVLRFVPLETALAAELLAPFPAKPDEPEGVLLVTDALAPAQAIYRRFDAVAEALRRLGGPWRALAALFRVVPGPLQEAGYALIARFRYRIFGRFATCPIPTPEQRTRILGL